MNKRSLPLLAALAGLFVLSFLLWRGHSPESRLPARVETTPRTVSPDLAGAEGPAASSEPLSAEARTLLAALRQLRNRTDVRPGEAVLGFKDDAAYQRFIARSGQAGLAVLGQVDALRAVRVRYTDLAALESEFTDHAADYSDVSGNIVFSVPGVPAAEARAVRSQVPFGNDALAFIGAAGDRSHWGRGVTIAILDTGVAGDPTFGTGRVSVLDIGLGTLPGTSAGDGHATGIAALAAGNAPDAPGVAPGATLLSVRVTDEAGSSDIFTLSRAIVAAVDAGAKVINISMGGYGTNAALSSAIAYAQSRDAVIVAAAGNDQAAQLAWPAADARVVSVGAVDRAEQQVIFSNSGPQLSISAPGYGVQTAWLNGQRGYVDGTSVSTPIVSGSIAALLSENPALTALQAAQTLTRAANDAGAPGADPAFGSGILNLGWAMNSSNPSYVDTAISSHHLNPAEQQMEFVVQNRSGVPVSGMTLTVRAGTTTASLPVPTLAPGQTQVVTMPLSRPLQNSSERIPVSTTLTNPAGLSDQVPANNRRSSVLVPSPKP